MKLTNMKLWKWTPAMATAALVLAISPLAHATTMVPDGTYTFQASASETLKSLNGSTVTFASDSITSWDLMDSAPEANGFVPLTPSNSSIISSGVLGTNAWYFSIGSPNGTPSTDASTFWFEGQNNLFGDQGGGAYGSLYDKAGDPIGSWTSRTATVPDSGSTFQLLAAACAGLGACHRWIRRTRVI